MTYHLWGDKWFREYGEELYQAIDYITKYVKRYSFCTLVCKEKYGSIRYEYIFAPGSAAFYNSKSILNRFLSLFGQKRIEFEFQGSKIVEYFPRLKWEASFLCKKWEKYGHWVLTNAVNNAIIKYPKVAPEIIEHFPGNLDGDYYDA